MQLMKPTYNPRVRLTDLSVSRRNCSLLSLHILQASTLAPLSGLGSAERELGNRETEKHIEDFKNGVV